MQKIRTFLWFNDDLEEAMMLADRICVMRAGRILQLGEPADIYYRPANPYVAGFIGDTNLLPITVSARDASGISWDSPHVTALDTYLPSAMVAAEVTPGPALMMVRPELIRRYDDGETPDFALSAVITEVFTKGGTVQYRAHSTQGFDLAVEIQGTSVLPMKLGEPVRLGWQKKDIWVLKPEAV